ncbi:MAG: porin family protein [Ignavibacteria bacterium]|jgi:hypothetical protein
MKKLIFVFSLIFLFSSLSNAQIYKGFGVKIGTSIANQYYRGFGEALSYKFGFTGGVFKEIHLFEKLNIVAGINYSQKGALEDWTKTSETGQYLGTDYFHRTVNMMSVELLAKYDGNTGYLSPYILAGVRMDIFISSNNVLNGEKLTPSFYSYPINNNKIFGGSIGLGLDFKPSKLLNLFIEGTYNPDFTNLGERTLPDGYIWKINNYSFDIRTGIKF